MPPKKVEKRDATEFVHSMGWLRDRIIIHNQEGPGGRGAVFVQLNGFPVHIPREKEVDVAKPLVQNLREAIMTITERDEKNEIFTRDAKRFNFEVVQENVNWDEIMNGENKDFIAMNIEYLKATGKWQDSPKKVEVA